MNSEARPLHNTNLPALSNFHSELNLTHLFLTFHILGQRRQDVPASHWIMYKVCALLRLVLVFEIRKYWMHYFCTDVICWSFLQKLTIHMPRNPEVGLSIKWYTEKLLFRMRILSFSRKDGSKQGPSSVVIECAAELNMFEDQTDHIAARPFF